MGEAGFGSVHCITNGLEGDRVVDPESVFHGKRMKNGWKDSAPWDYDLDPTKVWIPTGEEPETLRNTLDV